MNALALLLAVLIGVSLGLLGGGGSTLAVPVLVYVAELPVKPAIATSLLVVGAAAMVGAVRHFRAGNVEGRAATVFALVSMTTAYIGARLASRVPDAAQLILFAVIMLVVAVQMLRARPRSAAASSAPRSLVPVILAASVVGALTGLLGVGGGFLIVPALVMFAGLNMKRAVGTSLVVITANSFTGFLGYAGHVRIDWVLGGVFVAVAIGGVFIGTTLVRYTNEHSLRKGFAVFLMVVAVLILFEKRSAFGSAFTGSQSAASRP